MKLNNYPLVSVIMPNFNGEEYIENAITSVLSQTFIDFELIIIDDCSSDNSIKVVKEIIKNDSRIFLIELKKNKGPGFSRNKGIEISRGKYITFLDSDDLWSIDKLYVQINLMEKLKIPITHTDYGYINPKGLKSKKIFKTSNKPVGYKQLLKRTEISCLTIIYNKEIVGTHFFPEIRRKQDYVVWLNILKKGYQSIPLHFVSGYYRQQSTKKVIKRLSYVYSHFKLLKSKHVGLSFCDSVYYTISYFFNGVERYFNLLIK